MPRHWGSVMELERLLEPVSRHCCRCCDIERDFSSFKQKICTCFPYFIYAISVHACEYKSINVEESQFKHETHRFSIQSIKYIFIVLQKFSHNYSTRDNEATL